MPVRRLSASYGLGAIGLGVVGLIFGDFALQWQPVPASLPAREVFALLNALILLACGIATLVPRASARGSLGLALLYGVWVATLHLPRVVQTPLGVIEWLGFCEISALMAGGLMLFAAAKNSSAHSDATAFVARAIFGLCALMFGLSHFAYAQFTAGMVPKWIPGPLFWAYATGLGHVLAGAAILSGVRSRLAATMLAGMCLAFVVLLHAPRVAASPASQAEWTMLFIALSIAGAAWTMRCSKQTLSLEFVARTRKLPLSSGEGGQ